MKLHIIMMMNYMLSPISIIYIYNDINIYNIISENKKYYVKSYAERREERLKAEQLPQQAALIIPEKVIVVCLDKEQQPNQHLPEIVITNNTRLAIVVIIYLNILKDISLILLCIHI